MTQNLARAGMNGVVLARTSTDVIDLARPWMDPADPS